MVKFYCVFETTKEFNLNIKNKSLDDLPFMGLHFHLFITCLDNYNWVSFQNLIFQIYNELTSIRHKQKCISKYGYYEIENLDDKFIKYHTKQFEKNPSMEMIIKNY